VNVQDGGQPGGKPYFLDGCASHIGSALFPGRQRIFALQHQMGRTTPQMLIRHYWRSMQAHDLRFEEMSRLERTSGPLGTDVTAKILI
jgi:hypothetical protein